MQLYSKNRQESPPLAASGTDQHRASLGDDAQDFPNRNKHLVMPMTNMTIYKTELERQLTQAKPKTVKPPQIGSYWQGQGGFYAGVIRDTKTNERWHLILAEGQTEATWGGYDQKCEGADSFTDGIQNTQRLHSDSQDHPAAQWTSSLEIDGHSDFYLPAQKELNLIYTNLQDKCAPRWHWSSTQYSATHAWDQGFENGYQDFDDKDTTLAVRAVRRYYRCNCRPCAIFF